MIGKGVVHGVEEERWPRLHPQVSFHRAFD